MTYRKEGKNFFRGIILIDDVETSTDQGKRKPYEEREKRRKEYVSPHLREKRARRAYVEAFVKKHQENTKILIAYRECIWCQTRYAAKASGRGYCPEHRGIKSKYVVNGQLI